MKTIKLAPSLSKITLTKNVASTDFNGLHIEYTMPEDKYLERNPLEVKQALQAAIGFASKFWQIDNALARFFGFEGILSVVNTETGASVYCSINR